MKSAMDADLCYDEATIESGACMIDANSSNVGETSQGTGQNASAPPPYSPPPIMPYGQAGELETNPDARMWGMFCHLFAFAGFVFPVGNVIGPLVAWLIKKDQYPFVDDQGKEALNFQITMVIAMACAFVLVFVYIGLLLFPVIGIFDLIFTIIATIEANKGKRYRYPIALRLIK
jgi:hypothetical protein